MEELRIKGEILGNGKSLKKYSLDKSGYEIKPRLVVIPQDEEDVEEVLNYAKKNSQPLTARAAGSNLTGSAVGKGIIIDFSKMNTIKSINGGRVRVQPGVIYDALNDEMRKDGFFLPYSPSSGDVCTIGGNVATKASGFRGVKYGSVDNYVRNVRFVDPVHGVVDTAEGLPSDLEKAVINLKNKLHKDKKAMKTLKNRENLKTSSGYNLRALYMHERPEEIVAHLLVGSVGTLGLFTELELELAPIPKNRITCLGFFRDLIEASEAVPEIIKIGPSAVEVLDSSGINIVEEVSSRGPPLNSGALLLVEFDDNLATAEKRVEDALEKRATEYIIETSPRVQERLWEAREAVLTRVNEGERENERYVSFVDDLGVPVERLAEFVRELERIFKENRTKVTIYGHAGEGNLHLRPLIRRKNWRTRVRNLADLCFKAAFKCNGTLAGEHGSGRNKSPYLREELGDAVYRYFREVKKMFDPRGLLNPGVMFTKDDITKNMRY